MRNRHLNSGDVPKRGDCSDLSKLCASHVNLVVRFDCHVMGFVGGRSSYLCGASSHLWTQCFNVWLCRATFTRYVGEIQREVKDRQ